MFPHSFFYGSALLLLFTQATVPVKQEMKAYKSDTMHFTYRYPTRFEDQGGVASQALQEKASSGTAVEKAVVSCIKVPITAADTAGSFQMVMLMHMDTKCMGTPINSDSIAAVTTSMLSVSLSQMGEGETGAAVSYTVDGHPAGLVQGTSKIKNVGVTVYGVAACVLVNNDPVCWELIAQDRDSLPAMAAYPVAFDDHAEVPLIPADLLKK